MSLRFLLDTNVLSEPTRQSPNRKVLEKLQRFQDSVATASVVWHELSFGGSILEDGARKRFVQQYLSELAASIAILPYERTAADWHAAERARLERAGRPAPYADGQIAAIARVNDLILVTNNEDHFRPFSEIKIVNWHS